MRRSQLFVKTRKEVPADEEARNAQLLIRAGYIHKEMAGVYSYLHFGRIVINKIADIIREEMDSIGGNEILLSTLQSKELWERTGRWDDKVVDNWFKTKLASGTEVGIGLSHEEPLANLLTGFVSSYKDLPIYPYQIQTKFRNELRSKSGLMRGREFLMKDLYSFSRTQDEHQQFYDKVADAYLRIYDRLGLGDITYKTFASGGIFSQFSHEFQTISHVGEDTIYVDEQKKLAVNKEVYSDEVLADLGLSKGSLIERRAVEVGNIFPLGTKYTTSLDLYFTNENGQKQEVIMGSYGIGVSRLMGLLAEHFADDIGLVWPESVAPYKLYLAKIGNEPEVTRASDELYDKLTGAGVEVIYDDRDVRAGEMFADADLIGLPYRAVVSVKTLASGQFELKKRNQETAEFVTLDRLQETLVNKA